MAIPTISTVTPNVGHTGGLGLVEIIGTGFQTWVIPPAGGFPLPEPWPTVRVLFGGVPGRDVAVVSSTRLFVRPPPTPLANAKPAYGEGLVSVTVQNLRATGIPIALETATAVDAYRYARVQLGLETDYGRVTRQLIRLMRAQTIANVSNSTHSDFDYDTEDMANIVDVAKLPAIVIFGPSIVENRFLSINGRRNVSATQYESDRRRPAATDDLQYTFIGITDQKQEALSLQSSVRQFFKNNSWLYFPRHPTDPSKGVVAYDMQLDAGGIGFLAPSDQKSNLRSFSGSFVIRGFDHEDLPGFDQTDRVGRVHRVLPEDIPPAPPVEVKEIVSFEFPFGIGIVGLNTIDVTVPYGTDLTGLTPIITYDGASVAPASGAAHDFTAPATYTVTAADGTTHAYLVTVTVAAQPPASTAMSIGTNFWYHTRLDDNYSGETAMIPGINWASAYGPGTNGLAATNIWEPAFLSELAPYSTLRFMDWANTNWSQIETWSQRMLPTDPNNYEAYIDALSPPNNPGVAYEWLIDLCNRTNKDLWLCIPAKTDSNYWSQLATLVKNKLSPTLRCYIEYSNETWNGAFGQFQYTIDQGVALSLPGSNMYYQGQAFSLLQSLNIFQAFETVFGAPAMGSRVIRVFAYGGNTDTGREALRNIYKQVAFDPQMQTVDRLALAPYIGSELDGASGTIQSEFHSAIADALNGQVAEAVVDLQEFLIAKLITYEGGQHLLTNSLAWSANAAIYDEYTHMLDVWSEHFALFMHYTHTGKWTNAVGRSSWGAKDHTGQDIALAHKYRALRDWVLAHP